MPFTGQSERGSADSMGYVIAAIIVLLLVAGGVMFFTLNATRRSGTAEPGEPGAEGTPPGIVAPDESEAGDTTQHSEATEGADSSGLPGKVLHFRQYLVAASAPTLELGYSVDISNSYFR